MLAGLCVFPGQTARIWRAVVPLLRGSIAAWRSRPSWAWRARVVPLLRGGLHCGLSLPGMTEERDVVPLLRGGLHCGGTTSLTLVVDKIVVPLLRGGLHCGAGEEPGTRSKIRRVCGVSRAGDGCRARRLAAGAWLGCRVGAVRGPGRAAVPGIGRGSSRLRELSGPPARQQGRESPQSRSERARPRDTPKARFTVLWNVSCPHLERATSSCCCAAGSVPCATCSACPSLTPPAGPPPPATSPNPLRRARGAMAVRWAAAEYSGQVPSRRTDRSRAQGQMRCRV
jgi:hypothetical protein